MDSFDSTILVLGAYRQSLAVVRSLGEKHRVVLGCAETNSVSSSKFVSKTWLHPPLTQSHSETTWEALSELLEQESISWIFPVGDREIEWILDHQNKLPQGVGVLAPTSTVYDACQKKTAMFRQVQELNIPTAAFRSLRHASDLVDAIREVGFPCIVKPENEKSLVWGRKAVILKDEASFLGYQNGPNPDELPDHLIVQKYCLGGRRNLYFFAEHGQLRAHVEVAIDRTDQWDGTGYAVEGHTVKPDPEWEQHLERLVETLGYHGAGCLQYLVDRQSGESTFLEINARLGANFAAARYVGLDLPLWWLQLANQGTAGIPQPFQYSSGRRYTWLQGDLRGLRKAFRSRSLTHRQFASWVGRILLANLRSGCHVTFDWRDLGPTVATWCHRFPLATNLRRQGTGSRPGKLAVLKSLLRRRTGDHA